LQPKSAGIEERMHLVWDIMVVRHQLHQLCILFLLGWST